MRPNLKSELNRLAPVRGGYLPLNIALSATKAMTSSIETVQVPIQLLVPTRKLRILSVQHDCYIYDSVLTWYVYEGYFKQYCYISLAGNSSFDANGKASATGGTIGDVFNIMDKQFYGAIDLNLQNAPASDAFRISEVISLDRAFANCTIFVNWQIQAEYMP